MFDITVTQAVRDIGQRYHRCIPNHARNKANTMHVVVEQNMSPWLFYTPPSLPYRFYRCIVVKYFRYVFHDSSCNWCHRESELHRDKCAIVPGIRVNHVSKGGPKIISLSPGQVLKFTRTRHNLSILYHPFTYVICDHICASLVTWEQTG